MFLLSPSVSLLLRRGIQRGVLTLRREREYGTTLGALIGVALLLQLIIAVAFGVQGMHRLLSSQLDLRLQVREVATDRQVQEFLVAVRDLPIVRQVEYVTQEQAYERERSRNPELISFLEEFRITNPFPDTVAVSLRSLQDYQAFETFVRKAQWNSVVDPAFLSSATSQEQEVRQMIRLTEAGRALTLAFLALLLGVLVFVVVELTRRRALMRQEEIFVERISGAPDLAVLVPFAVEAAILLLVACALSGVLLALVLRVLPVVIPALQAAVLEPFRAEVTRLLFGALPVLIIVEIILIPCLALAGAFLGMRKKIGRGDLMLA